MLDILNPGQMILIGAIAVLLFGERLPEVSRKVGKHIMDFKKNIRGIQDQITSAIHTTPNTGSAKPSSYAAAEDAELHEEATAPKFEPPPAPPSRSVASSEPSPASSNSPGSGGA